MKLIAGVDIGNSTTEVVWGAAARWFHTVSGVRVRENHRDKRNAGKRRGIRAALETACERLGRPLSDISLARLNEAAPVIGDTAMETITETIITESSMIGIIHRLPREQARRRER